MALTITPTYLILILLTIFSQTHFSLPSQIIKPISNLRFLPTDVHDLLPQYGFPRGLLPQNVKSYNLSNDGDFEVELQSPCYVDLYEVVYYDKKIKGHLTYGSISHLSGVLVLELFLWFPVTHVDSDQVSGFDDIPTCTTEPMSIR